LFGNNSIERTVKIRIQIAQLWQGLHPLSLKQMIQAIYFEIKYYNGFNPQAKKTY